VSDSATDLGTFLAYAADVGASSLGVVPGTVTAVSPLTVTVAGSTTAAAGVSRLGTYNPRVGDVVMYYGFSGGNVTSARGGLYSNSAGGPDGGAVQAYTALGGAVAGGTWARLDFSAMVLVFPIAAGASTGVIFRGSWTASPAANCWFGGYASCKLYAT
jgi:hypothetical protein